MMPGIIFGGHFLTRSATQPLPLQNNGWGRAPLPLLLSISYALNDMLLHLWILRPDEINKRHDLIQSKTFKV